MAIMFCQCQQSFCCDPVLLASMMSITVMMMSDEDRLHHTAHVLSLLFLLSECLMTFLHLLTGSQPVESHGGSEVTSEKVALVVLAAILAVVVAALCYVSKLFCLKVDIQNSFRAGGEQMFPFPGVFTGK